MDVIQLARQVGKAIQEDERYISLRLAEQRNDQDEELRKLIAKFNRMRFDLNSEMQKGDSDSDEVARINMEMQKTYRDIMQNENMLSYNTAKAEVERMLGFVNQIITGSTNGEDPDIIEYSDGCSGDCGGCDGCS